ncbi:MAG TPA: hypothetical protein PKC45_05400 [Gemmatales bacterium]|nr:hypothetical protein [Gemmatales bacterium]
MPARPAPVLEALLHGVVDYAGLFPPARLEMSAAVTNYSRYRESETAWMLGRFICPAARLAELAPWRESIAAAERPWRIAALGRGGETAAEFLQNLQRDLEEIASFRSTFEDRVVVDAFEVRVPAGIVSAESDVIRAWLNSVYDLMERQGPPVLAPSFEAKPGTADDLGLASLLGALATEEFSSAAETRHRCLPGGFKLRCGGTEAAAFPSPAIVASTLAACRDDALPLKFTAGLHHPFRHQDAQLQVHMHGFVNVLLAALFAYQGDWTPLELQALLEDEARSHFRVANEQIAWGDHVLTAAQVSELREEYGLSFGSCSFDEPRDDLRALGWLPAD